MNKSETISELSKALVLFQGKLIKVKKDSTNPFFKNKYASLSNIIEGTQEELAKCGLAVIQLPAGVNQLETILIHESGEFISETYEMRPTKNDPQGLGSAITYQRRYALGAILCLNIDEDDDGNEASKPETKKKEVKKEPEIMPQTRFDNMMKQVQATDSMELASQLITKARKYFIFSDEQENVLRDWEDNRISETQN